MQKKNKWKDFDIGFQLAELLNMLCFLQSAMSTAWFL